MLDFCFASLLRTTCFEVLSESTNRQQSQCSNASFDLDPLGVDQSRGCDERAAAPTKKKAKFNIVVGIKHLEPGDMMSCDSYTV